MNAKRITRWAVSLVAVGALALAGCAAGDGKGSSSAGSSSALNPANPVQIELWTYYNGTQQQAFESLVDEFNATAGKDQGIVVTSSSQGGVSDLAEAVTNSAQGLVGSANMPDAFLSYPDTASVIDGLGRVADLSKYVTDEQKSQYVADFLAEGDLNGTGSLKVFPVAKSTETFQMNLTDWQVFADATGATLDELTTVEGITAVSQRYYAWTDALTPEVPNDGRPFFGRDVVANYLLTGSKQLGHQIVSVQDGQATLEFDRATMKTLWDNYYVPMVQGWFTAEGKFRSDAVKTGEALSYVGSSSAVVYFPQMVTVDDQTSYPIEMAALPSPTFKDGVPCTVQQGAGFVVTKSDERKEQACVEFLLWFTAKEQNSEFVISAGYVPVTKDALTLENLQTEAAHMQGTSENYLINLPATLDTINAGVYTTAPFKGGVEARNILESSLLDKAKADRAAVRAALDAGVSPADAVAPYLTDAEFDTWLADFTTQMKAAIA